ncbi:MAG: ribonuclease HII, partial [Clostridia bacterium]|nr:ribonuclease HII [Clostridia bacterium]
DALNSLLPYPEYLLVDAVKHDFGIPYKAIIHGDALSYSIACASVLAKVTRDKIMEGYDKVYPEYGFAKHKGYGTKQHIEALQKYGPCPIHRKTFIKNFVEV